MIRPAGPPPSDPRLAAVFQLLDGRPEEFVWDRNRSGLDVRCANEVQQLANRARIKAFAPDANVLVLFLYKDSLVPFSDDRFSYGAVTFKRGVDPEATRSVIDFALSGLDPARRPKEVRKTFPYTVPR